MFVKGIIYYCWNADKYPDFVYCNHVDTVQTPKLVMKISVRRITMDFSIRRSPCGSLPESEPGLHPDWYPAKNIYGGTGNLKFIDYCDNLLKRSINRI